MNIALNLKCIKVEKKIFAGSNPGHWTNCSIIILAFNYNDVLYMIFNQCALGTLLLKTESTRVQQLRAAMLMHAPDP